MPNVSGHHVFDVFVPSYFLITNMRVATDDFFCYVFLLLLNWSSLALNILVLFPSLGRVIIVNASSDRNSKFTAGFPVTMAISAAYRTAHSLSKTN